MPTLPPLIGRNREQAELAHARDSGRPELIAVYGRRRIGKTYLIRTFFAGSLLFELTGVREAPMADQLANFARALQQVTKFDHRVPDNWTDAFRELITYLEPRLATARGVVFFDELPWLAGRRSNLLPAFEHFWNSWASRQPNLIVVICGSAASWMIAKVLHQKGGLHNRVTRSLALQPFNLAETEAFLRSRKLELERPQILELAMALGGCPYYLDYVRPGRSAAQTIDALFFPAGAPLRDEFDQLFAALFEHHERHLEVIRFLARRQSGFNRTELAEATSFGTGGNLSTILQELEASGFVARTPAFGHQTRDPLYRLIDEYTLFHLNWLQGRRALAPGENRWIAVRGTPAWHAWSGYSFENLCLRHVAQIKGDLGISGVQTEEASWRKAGPDGGAQIDLLIDRRDGVINVCEMKFCAEEFVIEKRYAEALRQKLAVFRRATRTRKSLFLTFVTPAGLKANAWSQELVQNSVTGDALLSVGSIVDGPERDFRLGN